MFLQCSYNVLATYKCSSNIVGTFCVLTGSPSVFLYLKPNKQSPEYLIGTGLRLAYTRRLADHWIQPEIIFAIERADICIRTECAAPVNHTNVLTIDCEQRFNSV